MVVSPSEAAIEKRDFDKDNIFDPRVEHIRFHRIKISVRLLRGRTKQVEVPNNYPRARDTGGHGGKLSEREKNRFVEALTGAVIISNMKERSDVVEEKIVVRRKMRERERDWLQTKR